MSSSRIAAKINARMKKISGTQSAIKRARCPIVSGRLAWARFEGSAGKTSSDGLAGNAAPQLEQNGMGCTSFEQFGQRISPPYWPLAPASTRTTISVRSS